MARYELLERVGVGGMAEIFRGVAVAGGGFEKHVAIKRILPHLSKDRRFVELLITEAKTLSQLRHRNIVQIYDVGLGDDGQYFLVMEFVDGVDLGALYDSLERRGRVLPIEVSLHIGAEICEALDHAHRVKRADGVPLGLVHRDVSPSNILLSRSGEVKLTDFGIAKRMEEVTGHGGVRGKFAYISPEQSHNVHVDARSDVFSCGIVLYELIVGKRLFSQLSDFDALRMVREARVPRPREVRRDLDPEIESILLTALAQRPEDRFDSAAAFSARLRSYRYSMESTIPDPATELAAAIALTGREPSSLPLAAENTVVRISTASGFVAEFAEDSETLVARIASSGARGGGLPSPAAQLMPLPYIEGEGSGPIADEFDDAETRSVAIGGGKPAMGGLEDDVVTVARMVDPIVRDLTVPPRPPRVATLDRTPPPTPAPIVSSIPVISSASPVIEEDRLFGVSRRRAILILCGVAAVAAVIAFVIVGALLGPEPSGSTGEAAAAGAPRNPSDAAAAVDGGVPAAAKAAADPEPDSPVATEPAAVKKKPIKRRKKVRARRDRDRERSARKKQRRR